MHYDMPMNGTCAITVSFDVDDNDYVHNVVFINGCHGNTQGVSALAEGMKREDIIERLKGIKCSVKPTSCPDQFARALENIS